LNALLEVSLANAKINISNACFYGIGPNATGLVIKGRFRDENTKYRCGMNEAGTIIRSIL
jgi:hypothetical protein